VTGSVMCVCVAVERSNRCVFRVSLCLALLELFRFYPRNNLRKRYRNDDTVHFSSWTFQYGRTEKSSNFRYDRDDTTAIFFFFYLIKRVHYAKKTNERFFEFFKMFVFDTFIYIKCDETCAA